MMPEISRQLVEIWPDTAAPHAQVVVRGLSADSRRVKPGDVFIAQKGLHQDARDFIVEVIGQGAVAVFAEQGQKWTEDRVINGVPVLVVENLPARLGEIAARFYGDPSRDMTVLAVTGTNGKTSVAHLLAGSLTGLGKKAAVLGTVGNGLYGQLHKSSHTTLDAIQLQKCFAEFRAQGVQYVAMEASSHGLAQGRLHGTHIHTALFTNLSRDHLDYHGTMTAYAAAKAKLFTWPGLRAAVLNADEAQFALQKILLGKDITCLSYSQRGVAQADIQAERIIPSLHGLHMDVRTPVGSSRLQSPLLGRFNVSNLLAVLGGLLSVGIALPQALKALAQVPAVPGRMECFGGQGLPTVVVDYAHTPDALEKALISLREHTEGKLCCVFGCGGDRDKGKRPQMAVVAEHLADRVIVTSDNPRNEKAEAIIADIEAGFHARDKIFIEADRRSAIRLAVQAAGTSDIVLVAGKGHEDYQEIMGVRQPFSDVTEVKAALAARGQA